MSAGEGDNTLALEMLRIPMRGYETELLDTIVSAMPDERYASP